MSLSLVFAPTSFHNSFFFFFSSVIFKLNILIIVHYILHPSLVVLCSRLFDLGYVGIPAAACCAPLRVRQAQKSATISTTTMKERTLAAPGVIKPAPPFPMWLDYASPVPVNPKQPHNNAMLLSFEIEPRQRPVAIFQGKRRGFSR